MPDRSREDDELLAQRLMRFGLVAGSLGLLALVYRMPGLLSAPFQIEKPSVAWHAAGVLVGFGVSALARWLPRARSTLLAIDALAMPATAICYGLMGRYLAPNAAMLGISPHLTVLLAASNGVFGRATFIPSSGRRTLAISAACFPGVALASFGPSTPPALAGHAIANQVLWWTIATVVATVASNVIYGLREEVRTVRQYGQYTLEEKVGEGGMGVVYQARHAMLRRPTALKLLPPGRAGRRAVARFEKEVRLTARLSHPNTVTIFDYGRTPDGVFYYAMELLDGETLEDIVATTGALPVARAVRIGRQVSGALAEAHALGLVHRDVKPANIMLCAAIGGEADVAKVLDFGLVRDENADLGQSGATAFAGTPLYMSPEAISDPSSVSGASDIYAVGAVMYFLLTGEPLFEATTTVEVYASQLHQEPVPPSRRTKAPIPPELEALVVSCLAKSPRDRPASARDLARAFERIEKTLEPWDGDKAQAWWEQNRTAIARYRKQRTSKTLSDAPLGASRTLAIDFVRR